MDDSINLDITFGSFMTLFVRKLNKFDKIKFL